VHFVQKYICFVMVSSNDIKIYIVYVVPYGR
jgi:hypothetical protein